MFLYEICDIKALVPLVDTKNVLRRQLLYDYNTIHASHHHLYDLKSQEATKVRSTTDYNLGLIKNIMLSQST